MKKMTVRALAAVALVTSMAHGFAPISPVRSPISPKASPSFVVMGVSSMGSETSSSSSSKQEQWRDQLQSKEVQRVREDLLRNFLRQGRSREYAEAEVDEFLNDPERSQPFLEMKRYAASQADDLLAPEPIFQCILAFFSGFALHYLLRS
uniref:Uncharacterized protein n=1 Tax=Attheya septentrionalis TaxID=420275 RepID=A0A7S2UB18_9STRA|mmetsp:Transcript_18195/g.32983  ORF Transcript_18195/g.32983 Transcript_18195/m.32983 type:complete len:150 (+) Transcript_18195:183-632(+)|eukprot:CAMPEP_0198285962 /NCGR_PEP_ID=MMETSP1449-20131203/5173_1 /TAXON_ID=420275 /ORGANISM="Attheya septentrionalis, Strain CCMP2084" /LENGTH=149 /DNA_ID=CAMNT_0043983581 /DNA_START=183 /DNA_END=632 /DNA_ORIENTATION=-